MSTSMFFGYMSRWIFDLLGRDQDKRRFIILFAMLTVGMGMNVVNAQSIKDNAQSIKDFGGKLEDHSSQLHDLNSKFEIFVAYISTQSEKDKEQDDRIKRIAKKHDDQIKKLGDQDKEHDDQFKKQDKRIKTLEEQG